MPVYEANKYQKKTRNWTYRYCSICGMKYHKNENAFYFNEEKYSTVCNICVSLKKYIGRYRKPFPPEIRDKIIKLRRKIKTVCDTTSKICYDCGFILPVSTYYFQKDKTRTTGFRGHCKRCKVGYFQETLIARTREEHLLNQREFKKKPALYDTWIDKIGYAEEAQKTEEGHLQVKCKYCDRWFTPKYISVENRYRSLIGQVTGENSLYCSDGCKRACPTFQQQWTEKQYKVKSSREANPILRKIVLKRDKYKCQSCGVLGDGCVELHCHHVLPATQNPMQSNDPDNCITLCKQCHKEIHSKNGCKYYELRCEAA
jgi:hypothetical protein